MPLFDSLLSVIAPHNCLGCGCEGSLLCASCTQILPPDKAGACIRCGLLPALNMLCVSCRHQSPLGAIRARTSYEAIAKQLIHRFKFERASAAAKPIARAMAGLLPIPFAETSNAIVVPVPTATSRVRARGFDHAEMLAKYIAKEAKLPYMAMIGRLTQARQLGASRIQRRTQLKHAFKVRKAALCNDRQIILVDDVITTGSSLEACAALLHEAGAANVFGLVFAHQHAKSDDFTQ